MVAAKIVRAAERGVEARPAPTVTGGRHVDAAIRFSSVLLPLPLRPRIARSRLRERHARLSQHAPGQVALAVVPADAVETDDRAGVIWSR